MVARPDYPAGDGRRFDAVTPVGHREGSLEVSWSERRRAKLFADLDALAADETRGPLWLVHPRQRRRHALQRVVTTAEVVDLASIDLAALHAFETV